MHSCWDLRWLQHLFCETSVLNLPFLIHTTTIYLIYHHLRSKRFNTLCSLQKCVFILPSIIKDKSILQVYSLANLIKYMKYVISNDDRLILHTSSFT